MLVGFGALAGARTDTTASVLSGAMRFASTLALQDNKTYRIIIDMDKRAFWTEVANTEDPCARFAPASSDLSVEEAIAAEAREDDDDEEGALPTASFSKDERDLLARKFEPDTNVTGVITDLHDDVQHTGRVAIYFYPSGDSQRAMLWIGAATEGEGDEAVFEPELTLEVHPLGRVTRRSEVARPDEFLRRLE
jgi:hypothetical protein